MKRRALFGSTVTAFCVLATLSVAISPTFAGPPKNESECVFYTRGGGSGAGGNPCERLDCNEEGTWSYKITSSQHPAERERVCVNHATKTCTVGSVSYCLGERLVFANSSCSGTPTTSTPIQVPKFGC